MTTVRTRVDLHVDKPPYQVPSMAQIVAEPRNGLTVASLFSGGGGSSLGYRMAGYDVIYASEFVQAARDTYAANASPGTFLDPRDIREVSGLDILKQVNLEPGQLDLLDGSPPCASFSTAGNRERDWGKRKVYSDTAQRTDDLFFEYIRILRDIRPRCFVAENVSGLIKGTAKGYFKDIHRAMRDAGYVVQARLLNAAWLGVPQARQRLIFIGVRDDVGRQPAFPKPLPYLYTVRDALPWIDECHARVIHDTSGQFGSGDVTDRPSPTISVGVNTVNSQHYQIHGPGLITHDPETGKDIRISGYAIGEDWQRLQVGQERRYQSSSLASETAPSPTITQTGGQVGAAGVMHATQCRKFTLVELRAICGFPADFVLTGTYEQRWERLGRAVPPLMMKAVAEALRDRVLLG